LSVGIFTNSVWGKRVPGRRLQALCGHDRLGSSAGVAELNRLFRAGMRSAKKGDGSHIAPNARVRKGSSKLKRGLIHVEAPRIRPGTARQPAPEHCRVLRLPCRSRLRFNRGDGRDRRLPRRISRQLGSLAGRGAPRQAHEIIAKLCRGGDLQAISGLFRLELQDLSAGLGAQAVLSATIGRSSHNSSAL
jgi:hypothetical protein